MDAAVNQRSEIGDTKILLDPFAFFPTRRSQIGGVGGKDFSSDPCYAFHTVYQSCRPGPATFKIRIADLTATNGTLVLRVNALPADLSRDAKQLKTAQVPLVVLAERHGEISIQISARRGMLYALLGHVYEVTDAQASGMVVTLVGRDDGSQLVEDLEEARHTIFGARATRNAMHLISQSPATLERPVTQMCTAAQFDEPAYDHWISAMRAPKHRHRKQWEFAYILQVLKSYGMMEPGARGLGFGVGVEPIPAVLAAAGCSVVATDLADGDERAGAWHDTGQHGAQIADLRFSEICADDVFEQNVAFRAVDMNDIPTDLRGFDFVWSSCALEHLGSIENGLRFIEKSLECLNIGGVAVHTTEFNLVSNTATVDDMGTVLFRRQDIERLAFHLMSQGHTVSQIKYDSGNEPLDRHIDMPPYVSEPHLKLALSQYVTTSFGIVIRRGDV